MINTVLMLAAPVIWRLCSGVRSIRNRRRGRPVGLGAAIAVVWELGEYVTFIQQGTELDGAYEDTLSDQLLGTTGAVCAGVLVFLATGGRQDRSVE